MKEKMPKGFVPYPTSEEVSAFGKRCAEFAEGVKGSAGMIGTLAYRCAIDLDHLGRLIAESPVKHTGHMNLIVTLKSPGKQKGGNARAAKLSPERKKEIAKQGAKARWTKA